MPTTLLPGGVYGIPSVFFYKSDVGVIIGKGAENRASCHPLNVIRNIKMVISNTSTHQFSIDGTTFSKKDIVRHIFEEIARVSRDECKRRLLDRQGIEGAVVSVPAKFSMLEVDLIRQAAEAAGLRVLQFIPEPVAAAIAYFQAPAAEDHRTVLVYDLGGGTCDVAVVRADRNATKWYKVDDSDMERIGGRDWDKVLIEIIKRKLRERNGQNLTLTPEDENELLKKAIEANHTLSTEESAHVDVVIANKAAWYSVDVERSEFERATAELLDSTMQIVRKMMAKCSSRIDHIVCVGGSSNMPQIRERMERDYPNIPVELYEPEKAIAFGAAIYAEKLGEDRFLQDICKFSYGIRYVQNYEEYHDEKRLRIFNKIFKGDTLPARASSDSSPLKDGYESVLFSIYESENMDDIYLPERGTEIGSVTITGLVDSLSTDTFTVTLEINRSGLLTAKAVEDKSGKSATTTIELKGYC